jgi:hypothetical protein
MPHTPIDLDAARVLAAAGAISVVQLTATPDGLIIVFNNSFIVSNRFKQVRYFKKADTCFDWLKGIAITQIDGVNLTGWIGNTDQVGSSGEPPTVENTKSKGKKKTLEGK